MNQNAFDFPHFPTRFQAVIWRNWGLAEPERLARILGTTTAMVNELAEQMGLIGDFGGVYKLWRTRGYITILRKNWHLLPVGQILELLDWNEDKLRFHLKEDDFLQIKLGGGNPKTDRVVYRPLTRGQLEATDTLRQIVQKHFPNRMFFEASPFSFPKPVIPEDPIEDKSPFRLRLTYAYCALYGDPLADPALDPYPDEILASYAATGINAVWLPGTLYTLIPWFGETEFSAGHEIRLRNLQKIARRTRQHGMELLLYLNEPRNMPDAFFTGRPDWRGAPAGNDCYALCTSIPDVLQCLKKGVAELFRRVPELGGVFTITMSENVTHCQSKRPIAHLCARCAGRPAEELPVEVNRAIAEGIHSINPSAHVIVWSWGWQQEWAEKAVGLLPDDVTLLCVSETFRPTLAMGISGRVGDYSMSKPGPGPLASKLWKAAGTRLQTMAKVQLNNTWECSAVPYIPVPQLVKQHLDNLRKEGISDLMVSWTLGGWPGGNFPLLHMDLHDFARSMAGEERAEELLRAWQVLCDAFAEFPLHESTQLHLAPQNCGPANLLFAKPSGYRATMVCFPYDDLESWCGGHFPEEVLESQFVKLSERWQEGLCLLSKLAPGIPSETKNRFDDMWRMAKVVGCHFSSCACQIAFIRRRSDQALAEMMSLLDQEIHEAKTLAAIVRKDARIGFEASNHYCYTYADLIEKVLNCEDLKIKINDHFSK